MCMDSLRRAGSVVKHQVARKPQLIRLGLFVFTVLLVLSLGKTPICRKIR
jgi:hypothetical protein